MMNLGIWVSQIGSDYLVVNLDATRSPQFYWSSKKKLCSRETLNEGHKSLNEKKLLW